MEAVKDHEVVNAFRVALMQANYEQDILSDNEYHNMIGSTFIDLLTKKSGKVDKEFEQKFLEMNLQSDSNTERPILSDFGDIIPVNLDSENNNHRKHQKWTIGEQKKLISLINKRILKDIDESEWSSIASKFNRSYTSVYQKALEISINPRIRNKKQKITENPICSLSEESVCISTSNICRDVPDVILTAEYDTYTDNQSFKTDCLSISRKKAIESVLEQMENRRGTKNQIFEVMMKMFNLPLNNKSSAQYKGFHQCLSKYFNHTKGFYTIKTSHPEFDVLSKKLQTLGKVAGLTPLDDCKSWKEKSFFILNQFSDKKARLDDIKSKVEQLLRETPPSSASNLDRNSSVWEKNMLKIFSKHDSLFDTSNSKSIFYL